MKVIRRHLASPAMVVACAALIVALGGVSYAAAVLPENSVGTAQLTKKAVTRAKIKKNAVTGAKVKNRSLMAADFKPDQLPTGPQGAKGDPGAPGPAGPKGDAGATGSPGLSDVEVVKAMVTNNSPTREEVLFPQCPVGKRLIAAGGSVGTLPADAGKVIITQAFPLSNTTAQVRADEVAGANPGSWQLVGYATCANVQ